MSQIAESRSSLIAEVMIFCLGLFVVESMSRGLRYDKSARIQNQSSGRLWGEIERSSIIGTRNSQCISYIAEYARPMSVEVALLAAVSHPHHEGDNRETLGKKQKHQC